MKRPTLSALLASLLLLLLTVGLTACDSQSAVDQQDDVAAQETTDELTGTLTQELSLSASQQQDLQGVMDRHEHRRQDPGFLWYVAADLQATLTDEQKERLFERTEQMQGEDGPGGFGRRDGPGGPGFGGPGGPGGDLLADLLTDEQKAAIAEIRENFRAQFEELQNALRNGDITAEEFREQAEALHEEMKAQIDALLTDEQKATLEARRAERQAEREAEREARMEAIRAAMSEALGLTTEQETAIYALQDSQQAERDALFQQFRDELLTREELQAALAELKAGGDEALQALLDETQWEIVLIHEALSLRMRRHAGRRGPGGQGPDGRGPGGRGPDGPGGFGGPGQGGPGQGGPGGLGG